MSNDDFPTEYDAVVFGTGTTESIIAAALSRIGQKVLHLDRNEYYSGDWACFHFEALQKWIKQNQDNTTDEKLALPKDFDPSSLLEDGETLHNLSIESSSISRVNQVVNIPEEKEVEQAEPQAEESKADEPAQPEGTTPSEDKSAEVENEDIENKGDAPPSKVESEKNEEETEAKKCAKKEWTLKEVKSQWRKFNIDLIPKVLYCRGSMVELLISSDVAKYCEFKSITRILTHTKGKLEQVPCSRSDVFSSKQVSMIEKRMMMKFLTFAMDYSKQPEEYQGFEDKPFTEFLKSKKMTANVQHYIQHAIAMATEDTSTLKGLESTQLFLQSLSRYGNTAFLWPVYGAGELPQCYCRMCAVFGGVYCLRRTGHSFITDSDNKCVGVIDTEGKRLKTKWLVMDSSYASPEALEGDTDRTLSRAILLTDRSMLGDSPDNITLFRLPSEDGKTAVITLYELGSNSYACPKDMYMIHLTCDGSGNGPESDFSAVMEKLFTTPQSDSMDERPRVLWSLFFSVKDTSKTTLAASAPDNVFVVAGPDSSLDFDHSIKQAREIFDKICPGEEFLPKAPNPEDIIWDDGEGNQPKESGFETKEGTENEEGKSDQAEGKEGPVESEDAEAAQTDAIKEENSDAKEKDSNVKSLSNQETSELDDNDAKSKEQ